MLNRGRKAKKEVSMLTGTTIYIDIDKNLYEAGRYNFYWLIKGRGWGYH